MTQEEHVRITAFVRETDQLMCRIFELKQLIDWLNNGQPVSVQVGEGRSSRWVKLSESTIDVIRTRLMLDFRKELDDMVSQFAERKFI